MGFVFWKLPAVIARQLPLVVLHGVTLCHFSSPDAYNIPIELGVPVSVCLSVNIFKHKYLHNHRDDHKQILSEASLGGGKAALGLVPDQIRTLVSMATDSPHRVIMWEFLWPF